ncbi:hypothetical protein X566_04815 [Afipia sp. P52-10]|uniref:DUF992 domain-containing protein n=1 Tax=Afipia sp. P52-10 TaxID=1429916 RepID=UPI0003DF3C87|nr:DUF992 domain-containing protein [Afipia sp. P52-10]ETR77021.1 hypothetical protein X566_04815 [Afipia sp. P52-10]
MRCVSALLTATVLAAATPAAAQEPLGPGVRIGILECTGGPSPGLIVGSVTELNCMLTTRNGRRAEPYAARINRLGVDLGVTERWALAWDVYGPSRRLPRGALAGEYAGAGASASIGPGAASNQLLGGPGDSIALIPREVAGQQGLNLAFGFEGMEIRPGPL